MKKNYLKVLIVFIFIFSFSISVKADLNCSSGKKYNIVETSPADPALFNTKATICSWTGPDGYSNVANDKGQISFFGEVGAKYVGETLPYELVEATVTALCPDGKCMTSSTIKVARCDSPHKKYDAYYTAGKTVAAQTVCDEEKDEDGVTHFKNCEKVCPCEGACTSASYVGGDTCVQACSGSLTDLDEPLTSGTAILNCTGFSAASVSVVNTLKCPNYTCVPTLTEIGACTPSFHIGDKNGPTAYCINPTLAFSSKHADTGNFVEDDTFLVNKCASSYATTDCGYANILTEAYWYNKDSKQIEDKSIELALRLWGAHNGAAGFDGIGLSAMWGDIADNQNSCWAAGHMEQLTVHFSPNVYKTTEQYIMNNLFHYITDDAVYRDYVNPITVSTDERFMLHCNMESLICGTGARKSKAYRAGFGLFFNTVLGNSKMMLHLNEVFGLSLATPNDVDLTTDEEGNTRIQVNYGDYIKTNETRNIKFDCDDIENSTEYSDAQKAVILPYCQSKIYYYDANGQKTETKPSYCIGKNSMWCTSTPVKIAICDMREYQRNISIVYPDKSTKKPVKLITCGAASEQTMFAVVDKDKGSTPNTIPGETSTETFTLPIYNCQGNCTSSQLRTTSATCEYRKDKVDGEVSNGFVKDPSLKCIINLKNTADKDMFDYSKEFGVNPNICRVFCSDEVEYYIPDKLTLKSGLTFKYDIGIKSHLKKTDGYPISNVVKSKRSCVSEIRYLKSFTNAINFESMYGLKPEFIKNALTYKDANHKYIENWKDLYHVLEKKSQSEANRNENLNELLFDLYNCNFFNKTMFDNNGVTAPRQRVFGNDVGTEYSYNIIHRDYNSNNSYGFEGCQINGNTNDCITMQGIRYSGGSEKSASEYIGKDPIISTNSVTSSSISDVRYCSGNSCYNYDASITFNSKEDFETYDYKSEMNNSVMNGKIPTNDYAMFSISTEVGFYNSSRFQSVASTGYVTVGISDNSKISLEPYTYPTSKNAFTMCSATAYDNANCDASKDIFCGRISNGRDLGPATTSSCKVTHLYGQMHTYKDRHDNQRLYDTINNTTDYTSPNCYIDFETSQPPTTPGNPNSNNTIYDITEYRNIDRKNIFPNANISASNTNWAKSNAITIREQIESSGDFIYTDDENKQYSFTITPDQIKAIRRYNNNNNSSYVEIGLKDCQQKDGMYVNCRSEFLDVIRSENSESNPEYATINGGHDGNDLFTSN